MEFLGTKTSDLKDCKGVLILKTVQHANDIPRCLHYSTLSTKNSKVIMNKHLNALQFLETWIFRGYLINAQTPRTGHPPLADKSF